MSAPTPAQPTDPNGVLIRAKDFPAEGWEWKPSGAPVHTEWLRLSPEIQTTVIEARPIDERVIDLRLTVSDTQEILLRTILLGDFGRRVYAACREALSREGLT